VKHRLFVGNLPYQLTDVELCRLFRRYGSRDADVATDHRGQSRGFGHVEVDPRKAEAAVREMNGRELEGRPLRVDQARPKNERWTRVWDNRDGWVSPAECR
jgi:RNA recognition motif-containing protein